MGKKDSKIAAKALERGDLIEASGRVLDMALRRMEGRYTKNSERMAWARVIAGVVSAAGGVLRDVDLDDLKERVEKLEVLRK